MRFLTFLLIFWGSFSLYAQVDSLPHLAHHTDEITTISFSPDGKYIASGSWDNSIIIQKIDSADTAVVQTLSDFKGAVKSLAFSRDGHKLIAGGQDGKINMYEFNDSFFSIATFDTALNINQTQINKVIYGPGMRTIFCADDQGKFLTYDLAKDKVMPIKTNSSITAAAVAIDRMSFFIANKGSASITQYTIFGKLIQSFQGHSNDITDLMVTTDRKFLISSSKDRTVKIWTIANGKVDHTFADHTRAVTDIDLDPFGMYLVSGGLDGKVNLYDIKERAKLKTQDLPNHRINAICISPTNTLIAAAAQPKGISKPAGYYLIDTELKARKINLPKKVTINKIPQPKKIEPSSTNTTRPKSQNATKKSITKSAKVNTDGTVVEKTKQVEIRIKDNDNKK